MVRPVTRPQSLGGVGVAGARHLLGADDIDHALGLALRVEHRGDAALDIRCCDYVVGEREPRRTQLDIAGHLSAGDHTDVVQLLRRVVRMYHRQPIVTGRQFQGVTAGFVRGGVGRHTREIQPRATDGRARIGRDNPSGQRARRPFFFKRRVVAHDLYLLATIGARDIDPGLFGRCFRQGHEHLQ